MILAGLLFSNQQKAAEATLGIAIVSILSLIGALVVLTRLINPFGFIGPVPFPGALPMAPFGMGMGMGFGFRGSLMAFSENDAAQTTSESGFAAAAQCVKDQVCVAPNVSYVTASLKKSLPSQSSIISYRDLLQFDKSTSGTKGVANEFLTAVTDKAFANVLTDAGANASTVDTTYFQLSKNNLDDVPVVIINSTQAIYDSVTALLGNKDVRKEIVYLQENHLKGSAAENKSLSANANCPKDYVPAYTARCISKCAPNQIDTLVGCMQPCAEGYVPLAQNAQTLCLNKNSFQTTDASNKCTKCPSDPKVIKLGCKCITIGELYIPESFPKTVIH